MKKVHRKLKKSGFTLVELLIVIIIIGILAGSLLLVAGSSTDKAEATKIASTMRTFKSGALMYYADETVWPTKLSDMNSYIDVEVSTDDKITLGKAEFELVSSDSSNLSIQATVTDANIQDKLKTIEGFNSSGDETFYLPIRK